jgi:hypothetical protein
MGQGSLYPKGRNPLNNKARIKQKVPFILMEEIISQQQSKEKKGECSPYHKGRNPQGTLSHLPLGLLLREDIFL